MLSEKEEKIIKRYYILLKIAIPSLIMAFLIGFIWLVLVTVDGLFLHGDIKITLSLNVYIGFAIGYITLFVYGFLYPRFGMLGETWKGILRKCQIRQTDFGNYDKIAEAQATRALGNLTGSSGLQAAGAVDTVDAAIDIGSSMLKNVVNVANRAGVSLPNTRKYTLSLVIIPVLILVCVFIPQYIESYDNLEYEKRLVSESVCKLNDIFEENCVYVSMDDINERYQDYGYDITGYLYDFDTDDRTRVTVTVNEEGLISDVIYSLSVNIKVSNDENIDKISNDLLKLQDMVNGVDINATDESIIGVYGLPDEFVQAFAEQSYYEDFKETYIDGEGNSIYISYETDTIENFDEYTNPYVFYRVVAAK